MSDSFSQILLKNLTFAPYIDENGIVNSELENKIGIYAIFNNEKNLEYVGYSRNLFMSLKQHLVRQTDKCYWFKYYLIERPSRSILEEIRSNWLAENDDLPKGNAEEEVFWTQPIDAKLTMTEDDKAQYRQNDELGKIKLLKKIARRLEEEVKQKLQNRNVTMEIRFNPKLKEDGLLDLK